MAEATTVEKIGKVTVDFSKNKTYIFRLTDNKKVKPMGVTPQGDLDPPYPRKWFLDNPTQTIDPATKKPRWARCLKGIDTIWMDEQKDIPKEQIPNMLDEFQFTDGELHVSMPMEYSRLKYLMHHSKLVDNKVDGVMAAFYLVNDDEKAEKEYEALQLRTQAEEKAMEADMNDLLPLATFFGIATKTPDGEPRKEAALRLEFAKAAAAKPDVFLKSIDSPRIKLAHKIQEAINDGTIDLNHVKGQAHWGETKAIIIALDEKKSPVDALVAFAMTNDKGAKEFIKKLSL